MHNRAALVVVLIATIATTVHAQRDPTERWNQRLAESAERLEGGDHAAALKNVDRVIREMFRQLGRGDAATRALGIAVSYKAVALAGLGREDDALWYWHTALALYPPVAERDLSPFGEAGAFLAAHREPRQGGMPDQSPKPDPKIEAPKLIRRVNPQFPRGVREFEGMGNFIVEVVITKDGKITAPRILQPLPAPTISYAFLEALRKWTFEPGTLNGEPVEMTFNLTANYNPSR